MDDQLANELQPELYLLICRFLDSGPCREAANQIRQQLQDHQLLPARVDWLGGRHSIDWQSFEARHPHIQGDFLPRVLARVSQLLEKQIPASVSTGDSLLGGGSQSLLRTSSDIVHHNESHFLYSNQHHAPRWPCHSRVHLFPPSIVSVLSARQCSGPRPISALVPTQLYEKFLMYRRFLGHLSCVYCVCFDRTGRYIFTGADDMLVKIWSAVDGRLLATLRGHAAEITDIAVNFENTLLAAGSCDKMIRVWCIKTTQPICVLTGHSGMITSVRFCPDSRNDNRYLVSTSSDGTICFWNWNARTSRFDLTPKKFIERIKQGAQLICFSFSGGGAFLAVGSSDHYVRVFHVSAPGGPQKVLEIQPHVDQVDSLQFSNLGLRFVSGSKDGTAHIWYFERQAWHNKALQMSQTLPGDQPPEGQENKTKLKVTMVGWSLDDAYVITAVNDHSIKVWESNSGRLKYVLREHEDEVFVIESHPVDPRLFLSGGHDGRIILWDLSVGRMIKMFFNQIEGQGYGAIFDCKWSPDGQMFASTDSHGHLTIYGMGDRSRYKRIPDEVFFHTDYRPLIRDSNHYVIDEQTQCAPHLMGPPFLVDIDGNPYPPHLQRLVPGREHCKDDQLVPYIAIQNERGVAEVLEPRQEPDQQLPPPPPPPAVADPAAGPPGQRPTIDDMIERLQLEQAGRSGQRFAGPAVGEPSGSSNHPALRRSGEVEGVRQSSGNWQSRSGPIRGIRQYVQALDRAALNRLCKQIHECSTLEEQSYLRELKRKPLLPTADAEKEAAERQRLTRRKKRMQQQRQGIRPNARQHRVLRVELDGEISDPSIDTSNNEEDWMDSESSSSDSSEEEWNSEDARNRNKRARVLRNQIGGDSDSDEGTSRPSTNHRYNNNSHGGEGGSNRRTNRPRRGQLNGSGHNAREERRSNRNREPRASTSGGGGSGSSSTESPPSASSSSTSLPGAELLLNGIVRKIEPRLEAKFPEWLTAMKPRRTPYFPQIGDEVIYFRKGHELYVEAVIKRKLYNIKSRPQPLTRKTVRNQQLVKVLDIEFEVQSPRLVKLKLACLDNESREPTGETFALKYHDIPEVLDFLVLRQYYEASIQRNWQLQDRFRAIVDDKWWFGTIVGIEPDSQDNQFQMYRIMWTNNEEDQTSPWDMEPLDPEDTLAPEDGRLVSAEEYERLVQVSNEDEWANMDPDAQCERLIRGLEKIMDTSWAEHFNAPVDLNEYSNYVEYVAYPIDLSTIKERLTNRFYRSLDAVKFDVRFIEHNAVLFNQSHSMITRNARLVTSLCLQFINRLDCYNPTEIQQEIQQNKEQYESTDSEPEDLMELNVASGSGRSVGGIGGSSRVTRRTAKREIEPWISECNTLLHLLNRNVNFEPFRLPVNLEQYPDYNTIVTTPMDFGTIREQLLSGSYTHPKEMQRDLRLIVQNSKLYNTDKQSKIFKVTCVLQSIMKEKMDKIVSAYKNQNAAAKLSKSAAASKSRARTTTTTNGFANNADGDTYSQPSTSGYRSRGSASETGRVSSFPSTLNGHDLRKGGTTRYSLRNGELNEGSAKEHLKIKKEMLEDSDDEDYLPKTSKTTASTNGNRRSSRNSRSSRSSRNQKRYNDDDDDDDDEEEEEEEDEIEEEETVEEQQSLETEEEEEGDETEVEDDDLTEEETLEEEEEEEEEEESDGHHNGVGKRKRNLRPSPPIKKTKLNNGFSSLAKKSSARRGSSSTSISTVVSDSDTNIENNSSTDPDTSASSSSRYSTRGNVRRASHPQLQSKKRSSTTATATSSSSSRLSKTTSPAHGNQTSPRRTRKKVVNYAENFDQEEQDGSDYEYELGGFNAEQVSSRGRVRKLKGQSRPSLRSH